MLSIRAICVLLFVVVVAVVAVVAVVVAVVAVVVVVVVVAVAQNDFSFPVSLSSRAFVLPPHALFIVERERKTDKNTMGQTRRACIFCFEFCFETFSGSFLKEMRSASAVSLDAR
jgi:hypothetical protein